MWKVNYNFFLYVGKYGLKKDKCFVEILNDTLKTLNFTIDILKPPMKNLNLHLKLTRKFWISMLKFWYPMLKYWIPLMKSSIPKVKFYVPLLKSWFPMLKSWSPCWNSESPAEILIPQNEIRNPHDGFLHPQILCPKVLKS